MKTYAYLTSLALVASGAGFAGCDRDETVVEEQTTRTEVKRDADGDTDVLVRREEDVQSRIDRAGTAAAPDAEGIRDVLGQVPEAVLTRDGFDDLVERFVDADRNRIGAWIKGNKDFDQLNAKAELLAQKFQQRYRVAFDISDEDKLFDEQFVMIRQGEITEAQAAAARQDADANRDDAGRNVAMVEIRQSHGLPKLSVSMLHEAPGVWKIDVPDRISGEQLYDGVSKSIDRILAAEAHWPNSADDAKRYITHHLLLAIHGQDVL